MLIWLDGADSPKGRPNENLAREFLELFTLGVGNYTEADVREAARALTGWVESRPVAVRRRRGAPFRSKGIRRPEPRNSSAVSAAGGQTTSCGSRSNSPPVLPSFAESSTAISSGTTRSPTGLIEPLARELRAGDYSIRRVVALILRSRHFYSPSAYRQRIASPVELCVGLPRTLDVPKCRRPAPARRRGVRGAGAAPVLPAQRRRLGRRAAVDHQRERGDCEPTGSRR